MNNYTTAELIAIQKVILQVKFGLDPEDAAGLASSPIVGDVLRKISLSLSNIFSKNLNYDDFTIPEQYLQGIKVHITNTQNWNSFSRELRVELIKNFCMPYSLSPKDLDNFLKDV